MRHTYLPIDLLDETGLFFAPSKIVRNLLKYVSIEI